MRSLALTSAAVMAITGDTRNVSDVDESRVIKATMHTPVAFWRPTRLRSSASTTRSDHSVPSTIPPATVLESRLAVCPSWVRQQLEDVAGLIGEVPEHAKAEFRRLNIGFVLHPVHDEGTAPVPARRGRGRLPAPRVQSPRHITYCRLISPSTRTANGAAAARTIAFLTCAIASLVPTSSGTAVADLASSRRAASHASRRGAIITVERSNR